jgi:hypothetical protein
MGQDAAEECEEAFAYGFEKGIIMAMLKPEWAQGFYLKLREYYLLTHAPADLAVWEEEAAETCQAIPLTAEVSPADHCVPTGGLPAGGDGHGDGSEAQIGPNAGA